MTDEQLKEIFCQAAARVLSEWGRHPTAVNDLAQDLWAWYLGSPSTRLKMEGLSKLEVAATAAMHARQLLSEQTLDGNTFQGKDLYSGDCVREALRGESTNKYLNSILPHARVNLAARNSRQADAVARRYDDKEISTVPAEKMVLSRGVKSLTREVNVMYITADEECIGSRHAVFPETRKQQGGYSDPTGDMAVLLDEHPEYRFHFYEDTPIRQFLGGAASQPALDVGKINGLTARYRRSR